MDYNASSPSEVLNMEANIIKKLSGVMDTLQENIVQRMMGLKTDIHSTKSCVNQQGQDIAQIRESQMVSDNKMCRMEAKIERMECEMDDNMERLEEMQIQKNLMFFWSGRGRGCNTNRGLKF